MMNGAKDKGDGKTMGSAPGGKSHAKPPPINRPRADRLAEGSSTGNGGRTEHPANEARADSAGADVTTRPAQPSDKGKVKVRGQRSSEEKEESRPIPEVPDAESKVEPRKRPASRTPLPVKAAPIAEKGSRPVDSDEGPPAPQDRPPDTSSIERMLSEPEAKKALQSTAPLPRLALEDAIQAIVTADHRDPFAVLGMHVLTDEGDLVVRAFLPEAREAAVIDVADGRVIVHLDRMHDAGFFAGAIVGRGAPFPYRLRIMTDAGQAEIDDAYRFPPILSETDTRLLAEGGHLRSYRELGAHCRTLDGVAGVSFAVWAPNAHRVSVIGDFNGWDSRRHGMRFRHECGIWETFVPDARAGQFYKYEIKTAPGGPPLARTDPYAFEAERWPGSASIISDSGTYRWSDRRWMQARKQRNPLHAPLAIFEVHLGSWRRKPEEDARFLTYVELAEQLPQYVKELGFTHVEFLPVSEFNFDGSLGHHPIALYAPTGRFGTPDDFRLLVDRCHQEGIGVILNWVPVQFPDDQQAPVRFDGTSLYEHPDPRQQRHPQWDTLMYDYGRPGVRNYLLSNALFWLECYHIDGLRVDGLASILYLDHARSPGQWSRNRFGGHENLEAVDFLRRFNEVVYGEDSGAFTIAEEATGWPMVSRPTFIGGLGFGFKWNEVWLHETLRYMARIPIHKRYYHDELTHGPTYAFQENYVLAVSHDLVVGGKGPILGRMPGSRWDKFANLRLYYGLLYTQPGKKLIFMGSEFGQDREWNHESSLDWHLLDDPLHKGMQLLVGDLNKLYVSTPALHEGDCEESGFAWIDNNDTDQCVISYLRTAMSGGSTAVVVCNFTPVVRRNYRVGVPAGGFYAERLNTDSAQYGGSNAGNAGGVRADPEPLHGRPYSINLVLPPFAALILQCSDATPLQG